MYRAVKGLDTAYFDQQAHLKARSPKLLATPPMGAGALGRPTKHAEEAAICNWPAVRVRSEVWGVTIIGCWGQVGARFRECKLALGVF